MKTAKPIYLDYAATTPADPRVARAMRPYFSEAFGNPGSLHSFGQKAMAAVDKSRESIARSIGAEFRDLVFTASATEANNLALRGVFRNFEISKYRNIDSGPRPRIIVSAIEHESVLETARDLERDGVDVVYLPVDRWGIVDLKKLKESLTENTVLVSIMCANNEIGTIQPIAEIAAIIQDFRAQCPVPNAQAPFFHADASQALQFLDCDVRALGVDLMTISAHKIYGPKGAGALYRKNLEFRIQNIGEERIKNPLNSKFQILDSIISGGDQEFGLRSGTENVPAIVGFAKAIELLKPRDAANERIAGLRDYLWREIRKIYPKARINGVPVPSPLAARLARRSPAKAARSPLPNILNIYFPGYDAQDLLTRLDLSGVAASSGSACQARAFQSSYVIEALGYNRERARSSVRFSFGRPTTRDDVKRAVSLLKRILAKES